MHLHATIYIQTYMQLCTYTYARELESNKQTNGHTNDETNERTNGHATDETNERMNERTDAQPGGVNFSSLA